MKTLLRHVHKVQYQRKTFNLDNIDWLNTSCRHFVKDNLSVCCRQNRMEQSAFRNVSCPRLSIWPACPGQVREGGFARSRPSKGHGLIVCIPNPLKGHTLFMVVTERLQRWKYTRIECVEWAVAKPWQSPPSAFLLLQVASVML